MLSKALTHDHGEHFVLKTEVDLEFLKIASFLKKRRMDVGLGVHCLA